MARLVRVPSVTGDERAAIELVAELCAEHGIAAEVREHDLGAVRADPGHPGEEAERSELVGLRASAGAGDRRLCLNGHLDVVAAGEEPWDAWSGRIDSHFVHGRGAADMKGGVVALIHAMAAVPDPPCEVVLLAVSSEEDGGQGTFAALREDAAFDACLIPEPTDFRVICAHGGALTFTGVVRGRAAHAALRLAGESAIDRYLPVHERLADLERAMNADVENALMAELELPYPLVVGRLAAGSWSSTVPDRLEFEGRVGVPVGASPDDVRRLFEETVGDEVEVAWTGGQFGSGATAPGHPFVQALAPHADGIAGSPYGADMRLFTERGIPTVMLGPGEVDRIHGVGERVRIDDLVRTAELAVRAIYAFA